MSSTVGLSNSKSAQPGQLGRYGGLNEASPTSPSIKRRLTEMSPEPKSLGSRREFSPSMDKQSALARRSELLYPQSADKDDLKQIREQDESVSDTKS